MITTIISVIIGAAILIGIIRSIIEAFPVVGIVLAVIIAFVLILVLINVIYSFVKIFSKKKSQKDKIPPKKTKESKPDFLETMKKEEDNQRNFWEK